MFNLSDLSQVRRYQDELRREAEQPSPGQGNAAPEGSGAPPARPRSPGQLRLNAQRNNGPVVWDRRPVLRVRVGT